LDKYKKEYKKTKQDSEVKQKTKNEKIETLGSELEKTKQELTFLQKQNKQSKEKVQLLQKEVESLNSQLRQKELQVEEFHRDIAKTADSLKDKDNEIAKAVGHKMQNALIQEQKIQEARKTVENAKIKMLRFYDVDRFESNYLSDAV
jgi:chromosome segregation ATPase